jgi:hypothetical protein
MPRQFDRVQNGIFSSYTSDRVMVKLIFHPLTERNGKQYMQLETITDLDKSGNATNSIIPLSEPLMRQFNLLIRQSKAFLESTLELDQVDDYEVVHMEIYDRSTSSVIGLDYHLMNQTIKKNFPVARGFEYAYMTEVKDKETNERLEIIRSASTIPGMPVNPGLTKKVAIKPTNKFAGRRLQPDPDY